jgi:hypothetical protein
MTCSTARDRLSELVLGTLPTDQRESMERHLEACPGCRKERAELEEGLAAVALSLEPSGPPARLEHRVVQRVAEAAGRRVPPQAHRRLRTRVRRLGTVALLAAILATLSSGWALSQHRLVREVQRATRTKVLSLNDRISALVKDLGQSPLEARLFPTKGNTGLGSVAIVSVPNRDDLLIVDVYPPSPATGPYAVRLQTRGGDVFVAGTLKRTRAGDLILVDYSGLDLSRVQFVSVLNRAAQPVLTGLVRPYASPAP